MKKKNTKATCRKGITFLTAAILTATLAGSQAMPAAAGDYHTEIEVWTLIPDNVTIDEPTELYNVSLPGSVYGSLYWADDSYVPADRVQSCEVVFEPAEGVDLSGLSGWDSEAGVLTGYVTVVVNNLDSEYEEDEDSDYEEDSEYEEEDYEEYENNSEEDDSENEESSDSSDIDASSDTENGVTGTPAPTEGAEVTGTPAPTEEAEATGTPAPTEEAEVTGTPAPTEEAEATGTPAPTEEAEVTGTPAPTEEAEATGTPAPTEEAEATGTPAPIEEAEVTGTPAPTEEPDSIFDGEELPEEERPVAVEDAEELTDDEIQDYAQSNHSCAGISVSGIELPWYVQFRVSGGESYEYTNEDSAEIFRSYEFELWDLKNDTEYEIPDGEYISVTVPVKAGYEYTVEHHLDNGAMETIIPSVEGNIMVFSTHSFSPFGIAGSRPLVGDDVNSIIYPTVTPTSAPRATQAPSVTGTVSGGNSSAASSESSSNSSISGENNGSSAALSGSGNTGTSGVSGENSGSSTSASVNTGDYTAILPFVILIAAAAVIIIVVIVVRQKKKK